MDWQKRVFPLLAIVLVIVSAATAYGVYSVQAIDRDQQNAMQARLKITVKTNRVLQRKIARVTLEKMQLEAQLKEISVQRESLVKEVKNKGMRIARLEKVLSLKDQHVKDILDKMDYHETTIQGLVAKLDQEQKYTEELQQNLTLAQARIEEGLCAQKNLESHLREVKSKYGDSVELDKIIVSSLPPLQGKVMAANDEFDFVIVDLGEKDHLSLGSVLGIYRDEKLISRVQVEEVRPHTAAATVLPEWKSKKIDVDDMVIEL